MLLPWCGQLLLGGATYVEEDNVLAVVAGRTSDDR